MDTGERVLWLPGTSRPADEPDRANWKTFTIVVYYHQEAEVEMPARIKRAGGECYGYVEVPFRNDVGQHIGLLYAVVYQAAEALGLEVWT